MRTPNNSTSKMKKKLEVIEKKVKPVKKSRHECESPMTNIQNIINDRSHSNSIIDRLRDLESDDVEIVGNSVRVLEVVFKCFVVEGSMIFNESDDAQEKKYKRWLREQFITFKKRLMVFVNESDLALKQKYFTILLELFIAEGRRPTIRVEPTALHFPVEDLEGILHSLIQSDFDMEPFIKAFINYLEYDDVKFNMLLLIKKKFRNIPVEERPVTFLKNVIALMEHVTIPSKEDVAKKIVEMKVLFHREGDEFAKFKMSYELAKKKFTFIWMNILSSELSRSLSKKVLVILCDKIMPYLTSPLCLTDFLMESYDIGGSISLLALNGIFILMHEHNLEYPEFYVKLYNLIQPNILHTLYRPRFFYLTNIFLTSTHLPGYLVAAFVKRLARLALIAPPYCVLLLLPFIGNLLIRHPGLKTLLNNPSSTEVFYQDPYDADEPDPAKCNALKSSLWEIKTLQYHYSPQVVKIAHFIDHPLPRVEWDISLYLELTYSKMFEKEMRKKFEDVPLTFERPKGLFQRKEDKMSSYWTLA